RPGRNAAHAGVGMRMALATRQLTHAASGIGSAPWHRARALLEEHKALELVRVCPTRGGRGRLADPRVSAVSFPLPPMARAPRDACGALRRRQSLTVVHAPCAIVPRGLPPSLVVTIQARHGLVHPRGTATSPVLGWAASASSRAQRTAARPEAQRLLAVSQATRRAMD